MNDASDQSVKKEATPLVVGGEVSQPKKRFNKKLLIIAGAIVVVAVIAVIVALRLFFTSLDPNYLKIDQLDSQNTRIAKAQALARQPLPKEPRDLAMYYGTIASYLYSTKEYTYSEHYYLTAQKVANQHKLNEKEVNFYQGLSDVYKAMGNQQKADDYSGKAKALMDDVFKGVKFNGQPR